MFRKIRIVFLAVLAVGLFGCQEAKTGPDVIKVGTVSGPETQLMEAAKWVAKKCYGLNVKLIAFSDYTTPNVALSDGSIDVNMFQHLPYLEEQKKARGFSIVPVGRAFIYPMGVYSKKLKSIKALKLADQVAIPNDPSNEARALLLLQKMKLIRLRRGVTVLATPMDIVQNHKKLNIVTLDAAQLPRSLSDVAIAVINTNFAIASGLKLSQALEKESEDSLYANIFVAREDNKNSIKVKKLVASFHSQKVTNLAKQIFGDAAIPAWAPITNVLPCSTN